MALVHFGKALRGGAPCLRCGGYCFDADECARRVSDQLREDDAYDLVRVERARRVPEGDTDEVDDAKSAVGWLSCLVVVLKENIVVGGPPLSVLLGGGDWTSVQRDQWITAWVKVGSVAVSAIESAQRAGRLAEARELRHREGT